MTKADLVEQVTASIAKTAGPMISKKDCARVVDAFLEAVKDALKQQHNIEVRGFGTFKIRRRKTRMARNPRTGDPVEVAARPVPVFKPSKELRALVADEGEPEARGRSRACSVAARTRARRWSGPLRACRGAAPFRGNFQSCLPPPPPPSPSTSCSSRATPKRSGSRRIDVTLPSPATVADVVEHLRGAARRRASCPPKPLCARNLAHAGPDDAGAPTATRSPCCRRWPEGDAWPSSPTTRSISPPLLARGAVAGPRRRGVVPRAGARPSRGPGGPPARVLGLRPDGRGRVRAHRGGGRARAGRVAVALRHRIGLAGDRRCRRGRGRGVGAPRRRLRGLPAT